MLTITAAAADFIRQFLRSSTVTNPAVYLGQVSNSLDSPRFLYPLIYPQKNFLWLTTRINGFAFARFFFYPRSVRQALRKGLLDVGERGLVLKDADGKVVLPR